MTPVENRRQVLDAVSRHGFEAPPMESDELEDRLESGSPANGSSLRNSLEQLRIELAQERGLRQRSVAALDKTASMVVSERARRIEAEERADLAEGEGRMAVAALERVRTYRDLTARLEGISLRRRLRRRVRRVRHALWR